MDEKGEKILIKKKSMGFQNLNFLLQGVIHTAERTITIGDHLFSKDHNYTKLTGIMISMQDDLQKS